MKKNTLLYSRLLILSTLLVLSSCASIPNATLAPSVPPLPTVEHSMRVISKSTFKCTDKFQFIVVDIAGVTSEGKILIFRGFGYKDAVFVIVVYNSTDKKYEGLWINRTGGDIMDEFFTTVDQANMKYGSPCGLLRELTKGN